MYPFPPFLCFYYIFTINHRRRRHAAWGAHFLLFFSLFGKKISLNFLIIKTYGDILGYIGPIITNCSKHFGCAHHPKLFELKATAGSEMLSVYASSRGLVHGVTTASIVVRPTDQFVGVLLSCLLFREKQPGAVDNMYVYPFYPGLLAAHTQSVWCDIFSAKQLEARCLVVCVCACV